MMTMLGLAKVRASVSHCASALPNDHVTDPAGDVTNPPDEITDPMTMSQNTEDVTNQMVTSPTCLMTSSPNDDVTDPTMMSQTQLMTSRTQVMTSHTYLMMSQPNDDVTGLVTSHTN
ncbi:hypothetical protein HGM15179_020792 [Zosterops borbonicus]|uniref:Uncharacterized protein n=1 Tax=Zosterops borbonicus TaxID=364589 RepID=A0A8K1D5P6_9PASS|nr:hypothetical protein HGM15179_020792 [Zosterops borbonicus]